MTKGVWLMIYGVVLFLCGVAAYLVNPAYPLLLVAGAVGGGVMAGLGVVFLKGAPGGVVMAANMLTLVVMMFGLALAMNYWLKVVKDAAGPAEAAISTVIFAVSAVVLWRLKKKA